MFDDHRNQEIYVSNLSLSLLDNLKTPDPVHEFLRNWAHVNEHEPDTFGLRDFLSEMWPEGIPATVYASNIGNDPNAPAHKVDLLLRPVCEGPMARRPEVGGLTLALQAYRARGRLNVKRIEVAPHVPRRDFEAHLSGPIRWLAPEEHTDFWMSDGDFSAVSGLPFHRANTRKRLEAWRRYLDWKEKLARKNQIKVPYLAWRRESDTQLAFLVEKNEIPDRKLAGQELRVSFDSSQTNGKRTKVYKVGEVDRVIEPDSRGNEEQWEGIKIRRCHRMIQMQLDEEEAEQIQSTSLPQRGTLESNIAGEMATINNQRGGVSRLNNDQGFSPRLADFMFDSNNASIPLELPDELPEVNGGRELNPGQDEAVRKALAAPDLCLIQGPPGTGKTTVIADICLRAAHQGKRVLVTSQTNLAVDNALARLSDIPAVRALRIGASDRVDDEFKDFLAENVIDKWFANIAGHCWNRMDAAKELKTRLELQAEAVRKLSTILKLYQEHQQTLGETHSELRQAKQTEIETRERHRQLKVSYEEGIRSEERLSGVLKWCRGEGPLPPDGHLEWDDSLLELPQSFASEKPLSRLAQAVESEVALKDVLTALESCNNNEQSDPAAAAELHQLRIKKDGLIDSDEIDDLRCLGTINRRIKQLISGGWNQCTQELHRAARKVWAGSPPPSIDLLSSSLKPSSETRAALEEARELVLNELETSTAARDVVAELTMLYEQRKEQQQIQREEAKKALVQAKVKAEKAEAELGRYRQQVERIKEEINKVLSRWNQSWSEMEIEVESGVPTSRSLSQAEQLHQQNQQELGERVTRSSRWSSVQIEWLARLQEVSDSDREQLQTLYVRRANVVGMTCNEAGKRRTWQDSEFKPFDIVIIDEVSKATPPELILPMLLGEKSILVGDHRQLPPMFRERDASFSEAADSGEITQQEFQGFKKMVTASLFEELFEQAPNEIKAMLWTQYRMHPTIMDAINQFYEERLEAGPDREALAKNKQHHLNISDGSGGRLLTPKEHLLWIDSSRSLDGKPCWEQQQGSSKLNKLEIELIIGFLLKLGRSLKDWGYGQIQQFDIKTKEEGKSLYDLVASRWKNAPEEVLQDLFEERRVRLDGRAQPPETPARQGATLRIIGKKEVGIITFYGAQLKALRREIDRSRNRHPDLFGTMELRTNTVDRFQGMEKPIVLASLVRSKKGRLGDFVRGFQRINVGLSRAQKLLVIIAAQETWKNAQVPLPPLDGGEPVETPSYMNIIELVRRSGGMRFARQVLKK